MIHDLLSSALRRATDALGEDDAIAAAAALQEAALACEDALRQGLRLEPVHVRAIRPMYVSCCDAADGTRQRLAAALGAMGQARRASGAYHR